MKKTGINMKTKYTCTGCGTNYYTTEDKAPPPVKWSDGHKCNLVKSK